jgi:hypothetical protein
MFDRTVEEVKAGTVKVWADSREAGFIGEFAIITPGLNTLNFDQSVELQRLISKFYPSMPRYQKARVRAFHNSISMAWGHEVGLPFIH